MAVAAPLATVAEVMRRVSAADIRPLVLMAVAHHTAVALPTVVVDRMVAGHMAEAATIANNIPGAHFITN